MCQHCCTEYVMRPYAYSNYTPTHAPKVARRYEPTNHAAAAIAGIGFVIVVCTFLPVGLVTAPMALLRVSAFERGMAQGRYDPADIGHFAVARVLAWVSFALSLPWVLAALLVTCLMLD